MENSLTLSEDSGCWHKAERSSSFQRSVGSGEATALQAPLQVSVGSLQSPSYKLSYSQLTLCLHFLHKPP